MPEFVGRLRTPRLAAAPATPISGELYYNTTGNSPYCWNGTSWVASGGFTGPTSATPPATPSDGQLWVYPAAAASGVNWLFRYNAASASTYKWEFLGGPAIWAYLAADESSATVGAWTDLTTVGPEIVCARAGDYLVSADANVYTSGVAATALYIGITSGAGSPADPLISQGHEPGSTYLLSLVITQQALIGVSAGATARLRYFSGTAGTYHALKRKLSLTPIRVA
jgi:hypothetical protein